MVLKPIRKYKFQRWLHQLKMRCQIAYRVIFKEKHIVAIYFTEEDFLSLIEDDKMASDCVNVQFAGCMEHHGLRVIKELGNTISDAQIICDKAMFDVEASVLLKKNKLKQ